jgi:NAD(P)-dependent dehydrogenase (short-subunit alcohol dehydrogenase family)
VNNSDKESTMTETVKRKTMIVTGASQGIGAGVTKAFIKRGYNVVANSRKITESEFTPTDRLVLVDGNIGEAATAATIARNSHEHFRLDRWCRQ